MSKHPYKNLSLFSFVILYLMSCHHGDQNADPEIKPVAQVKVTTLQNKNMEQQVTLTATSVYLQRSQVNAPVAGFISRVNIKYGDAVNQGQVLYELETKERNALGNNAVGEDSNVKDFGKITIKAPAGGIVTTIDRQQTGEFIMEGNPLCTITQNGNLAFQLNVPYEYHSLVQGNNLCSIVLPDRSQLRAHIVKPLSSLNTSAQTQMYLVKPLQNTFLPEGLVATVLLTTRYKPNAQVLSKECVLSDELMKNFWIMKLINDSTAIKTDVKVGIRNINEVEILSPRLNTSDRILSEGNYGLADTALVKIIK
ncbi:hypothetical protein A3860_34515 [Niastella vici]|uniref:CzcB-like barrel-sandwich hybrid domain-containing protein n=1 Tax=Niastella vici TaxID=1703345 RepID=A0A1V9FPA8_9BACT|nr:HlyD family efflux transporter periplasmic adaptor subunit [Niastella vici]OQP60195.1 hypothetical protein A3860_34515 [Niastella vici]